MKYLAIASLAAVAVAVPAADSWENYSTTTSTWVEPTTTWNEWSTTTKKTPEAETTTWADWEEWDEDEKKADPTPWNEWEKEPKWTTTVVTAITTYCPKPTTIVHAGKTWVVSTATTLTITECPCTISVPVITKTSSSCR